MATYAGSVIAFAKGYAQLHGNISKKVISGSFTDLGQLKPLGRRTRGMVAGGASGSTTEWNTYVASFRRVFPHDVAQAQNYFAIFYHDATAATLDALTAVRGNVPPDGRRLQSALGRLRLDTAVGPVRLDDDHQAVGITGLFQGGANPIKRLHGVDHTFGGYFGRDDPPPSFETPACRAGNPPPWTR